MSKINSSRSQERKKYKSFLPNELRYSTEILPLRREKVLSKFTQEELDSCWESLTTNIIQNYQRGKATLIKGFGLFTFKGTEINLEGTTNDIFRDKKERSPVFLVSKEFNDTLKTGEYTKQYGLRYYTTRENKNIPISNLNYSEIAFSLSMTKDKVTEIIKHLILYINEAIVQKKFKNKVMPGLGVLILQQNILAVKFNENFKIIVRPKNRKMNNLKCNFSLDMCFDEAKDLDVGNYPNIYQMSESIKATNSLITECQQSAKTFLNDEFNIQIENSSTNINPQNTCFGNEKKKDNFYKNYFFFQKNHPFIFINDKNKKKNLSSSRNKILKTEFGTPRTGTGTGHVSHYNPLETLDNNTLKTMNYFKGTMIKYCKDLDVQKIGSISKEEIISMLMQNLPDLNHDLAQQIVEHYFITDQIDYMKFIALLIRGSKNCFIRKKHYFNFANILKGKKDSLTASNSKIIQNN